MLNTQIYGCINFKLPGNTPYRYTNIKSWVLNTRYWYMYKISANVPFCIRFNTCVCWNVCIDKTLLRCYVIFLYVCPLRPPTQASWHFTEMEHWSNMPIFIQWIPQLYVMWAMIIVAVSCTSCVVFVVKRLYKISCFWCFHGFTPK